MKEIPSFERNLEVSDAIQLTEFSNQQTLRFDTVLEEGATNSSGGQHQRLAIARALLENAPILILAEATSGLDTLLEHEIMDHLLKIGEKRKNFYIL